MIANCPQTSDAEHDALNYFPVRGRFFHFVDLFVVDALGEKLDLLFAKGNSQIKVGLQHWESFEPHRGRGLRPSKTPQAATDKICAGSLMALPPRIVQPARLEFRLLDGRTDIAAPSDGADEVGTAPNTQSVCGWLIVSHLDDALSVYDADGYPLGELILRSTATGPETDHSGALVD